MWRHKTLQITDAMITSKGERKVNEDFCGCWQSNLKRYYVLCDGLGGHGNGDEASRFVVNSIQQAICKHKLSMNESIAFAQEQLLRKQEQEGKQDSMKTTLTCLEIAEDKACFAHVGDSRVHWFQKGKYKLRSQDRSVPQMLVNSGRITEKEIRNHPDRSRLLRVMGTVWDKPKYQMSDLIEISSGSSFLLCSDGFWELIEEKEMARCLKKAQTPAEWLHMMESQILQKGQGTNMDNYTAVAVYIR